MEKQLDIKDLKALAYDIFIRIDELQKRLSEVSVKIFEASKKEVKSDGKNTK